MSLGWMPEGDHQFAPELPAIVESICYHCRRPTRWPVKSVNDAEAAYWRNRYHEQSGLVNDLIARCATERGHDAVRAFMLAGLLQIRDDEGEEWKRGISDR